MFIKPIHQEPGSLAVLISHAIARLPGEITKSKHFDAYLCTIWVNGHAWQCELLFRPGNPPTHAAIASDFATTPTLWQMLVNAESATS